MAMTLIMITMTFIVKQIKTQMKQLDELDEVAAVKHNVRKLRIEIDSESDYRERDKKEFPVPNSEYVEFPGRTKTIISKMMPSY